MNFVSFAVIATLMTCTASYAKKCRTWVDCLEEAEGFRACIRDYTTEDGFICGPDEGGSE